MLPVSISDFVLYSMSALVARMLFVNTKHAVDRDIETEALVACMLSVSTKHAVDRDMEIEALVACVMSVSTKHAVDRGEETEVLEVFDCVPRLRVGGLQCCDGVHVAVTGTYWSAVVAALPCCGGGQSAAGCCRAGLARWAHHLLQRCTKGTVFCSGFA